MINLEATFTDISGWHKNVHYSTGGSRSKYIALHPDTNEEYFFKGSKETLTGEIKFPTEFWSEIVSSKIGQFLEFPMLDYNIAYDSKHKQKIGCLSKSMVLSSKNKLTEGITYLTGFNSKYIPSEHKKDYTFQFICNALEKFYLGNYIENIIEIIVFDSIIGNSDRHQENWGVLSTYEQDENIVKEQILTAFDKIKNKLKKLSNNNLKEEVKIQVNMNPKYISYLYNHQFAPIYDSGCCLGREHIDEKVIKMLNDSQMIEAYIRKGESEIHWEGHLKKRNHFELIELLLTNYPAETKKYIARVEKKNNTESIKEIIENVDINVPKDLINFKLSESRKQLMFKLVTLRIEKLIQYL
ncbi:hypothetical protein C3L50_09430 [Flavobacterium alvei]|uniref:HipA-like C-terminal domain-containing protein n=1 Tax=Flavobacterium alvei TaxID=2080416 RepID=A0A2S5ACI5_9FLAO|nr:hypothetical protein [Flavobacterium alvei]POY40029.1 hypothetical protein C3L50_09430 [Flavobacterium alvei]